MRPSPLFLAAAALVATTSVASFRAPTPAAPATPSGPRAGTFEIDAKHSTVLFRVKHLDVSYAYGRFNEMSGAFEIAEDPAESSVQFEIAAASVDTANKQRDDHLRSPDFFNAVQFPKIVFESKKVAKKEGDVFAVTGDLAFHGRTGEITVDMTLVGEGDKGGQFGYRAGLEGSFTLEREAWGITTYPGAIGAEVQVTVSVEGVRP